MNNKRKKKKNIAVLPTGKPRLREVGDFLNFT
jgi:hypothetical protein